VRGRIGTDFTGHSSNAMNCCCTKLDRKPLGDAIEKLPKLDEERPVRHLEQLRSGASKGLDSKRRSIQSS